MSGTAYSFHRPPGSVTEYDETLTRILEFVESSSSSREEVQTWVIENIGNVESRRSTDRKITHFIKMGVLTEAENDLLELTDRGRKALDSDPQLVYFECLVNTYVGFDTMVSALVDGPLSADQLTERLTEAHPERWTSSDQPKRRRDWLRSLDIIEENSDELYQLTEVGSIRAAELGLIDQPLSDWDVDVYFISACNDDAREYFQDSIVEGVPGGAIPDVEAGETVPVWGRRDSKLADDPSAGDWILFYQSGARDLFTYAGRLRQDPLKEPELSEWVWNDKEFEWIYVFDSIIPIDIDAQWMQQSIRGYDRSHVQGIEKLGAGQDRGRYRLRFPYSSPREFVTAYTQPQYATLRAQLTANGQVILYGPPGTGKTYMATRFWGWWHASSAKRAGNPDGAMRSTTFHPAYSYEDFIEGLQADATDTGVVYEYDPGVFRESCRAARADREEPGDRHPAHLLLIDEINRGDISQILGELVTQLEWDKREGRPAEITTTLAHSGMTDFSVPSNLYLLSTMNTADRSIALLDAALRRRFRFMKVGVEPALPAFQYGYGERFESPISEAGANTAPDPTWIDEAMDDRENEDLTRQLRALSLLGVHSINRALVTDAGLDRGKQIGHTFLMSGRRHEEQATATELSEIWQYEIFPLLEEYFYGDFVTLEEEIMSGVPDFFRRSEQEFAQLGPEQLATALEKLIERSEYLEAD